MHLTRLLTQRAGLARRLAVRAAVMLVVVAGCVLLLGERMSDIRPEKVLAAMTAIPVEACLAALVFGLLSHVAVAGYDLLALSRIRRHVPWPRALAGGFAGTVMSEVLGFGLVTGSLARARIYRANGIGATEAVALSGVVAAGFFAGLGVLLALLVLVDPGVVAAVTGLAPGAVRALAATGLAAICLAGFLGSRRPRSLRVGALALRLPDARWLAKSAALATADLVPAALCLAVMLPEAALPSLPAFLAIYITGLALGYMIGAPGAAGPFEGILFLALPAVAPAELAAAILLYRCVYYVPPLGAALVILLRAPSAPRTELLSGDALRDRVEWVMDGSGLAEAELALLGDKHVYFPAQGEGFVFYGMWGRIWMVMGDPVAPSQAWTGLIDGLEAEARAAGATLAIYKATSGARAFWAARGYHLQALGEEAALSLGDWSLDGRARRELRRKIGGARKAGITLCRHEPGAHPAAAMGDVARDWAAAKGGEQSFSMGHWSPGFAGRHIAVSAWRNDRMVAFATFWVSGDGTEWMLDLMRQRTDGPNGTMYAILGDAIAMAQDRGAASFNLCMAPLSGLDRAEPVTMLARAAHHVYAHGNHRHGLQGMRRFKDVFRPGWSTRYLAVPNALALPEALLAAHGLVRRGGAAGRRATSRSPWLGPLADMAGPAPEDGPLDGTLAREKGNAHGKGDGDAQEAA